MSQHLKAIVLDALSDIKAQDVSALEVSEITSIADHIIIATGTSSRHLKSIADSVVKVAKQHKVLPLGVEGTKGSEWILIDLGHVIVHVMLSQSRAFYNIEKLWAPLAQIPESNAACLSGA